MEELVEKYIKLREVKTKLSNEYKQKVAKVDDIMDKIEAAILAQFNELGVESARTTAGTAYKQTRTSATVADWDAVLHFIQENDLYNMLEHRVSKNAVEEYVNENGALPPGVNWRQEVVINVRQGA